MSLDVVRMKRRLAWMVFVNLVAVLGAVSSGLAYFRHGDAWGLAGMVGALLMGFGAQIWFIAGLRGLHSLSEDATRQTRVGKGA
jgi:hypothetical protein